MAPPLGTDEYTDWVSNQLGRKVQFKQMPKPKSSIFTPN